jgi:hypothetical protein
LERHIIAALAFSLGLAQPWSGQYAADAAGPFSVAVSPAFFGGQFGTGNNIHVYEVPITAEYHAHHLRLSVEIPLITIVGKGLVSGGSVVQTTKRSGVRSGLGDIWFGGSYQVISQNGFMPEFSPYLKVKAPTASRQAGLGTGAPEMEIGGRVAWNIANRVLPFARYGYRLTSQAVRLHLKNSPVFGFGASFVAAPGQYVTAEMIDSGAIQQGVGASEYLLGAYTLRLSGRFDVQVYAVRGLTHNSPAFGGGLGVTTRF